jgi:hypothetical protein
LAAVCYLKFFKKWSVTTVPHRVLWNAVVKTSPFISVIAAYGDQMQTATYCRWPVSNAHHIDRQKVQ